jgi:hypothetical protein
MRLIEPSELVERLSIVNLQLGNSVYLFELDTQLFYLLYSACKFRLNTLRRLFTEYGFRVPNIISHQSLYLILFETAQGELNVLLFL